uniref:Ubiquitin-like protease family profile domain-containing protein n=1 Tax=Astyanax mexicanus TaxID=7994 RepID=A0A3B1K1T1_ASTMX
IGKTCLTREDFLSLGTSQDMEATVSRLQRLFTTGKDIFIADLYVVPTWLPPHNCDPMLSLPVMLLCDLFSCCLQLKKSGPSSILLCVVSFSGLAKRLVPGHWTEKTGLQLKDLPGQPFGNDCGIFMLMYALYIVLDAPFDFSVVSSFNLFQRNLLFKEHLLS